MIKSEPLQDLIIQYFNDTIIQFSGIIPHFWKFLLEREWHLLGVILNTKLGQRCYQFSIKTGNMAKQPWSKLFQHTTTSFLFN